MRFKRVLLINPAYKGHFPPFKPAGLGYIAEALAAAGIEHDYFDMGLDGGMRKLRNRIETFSPDLIGLQLMTYSYLEKYDLTRKIKNLAPLASIVAGGHHVSTVREAVLNECESIDYGVVLEGEETLVELCRGDLPVEEILGLIFRRGDQVIYTGDRPFIKDLDRLPIPRLEKFELGRYHSSTIHITSSRGCPHDCIMCPVRTTIGRQMRIRSASNVADELEYWVGRGHRRFDFTDDNFAISKDRVHAICDEIERRRLHPIELTCSNGVRADRVDRELLSRMRQVGFSWLSFGVEAGNDKVLKTLRKGEEMAVIERAIRDACDLGFDVDLFFLIGSPGETEDDVRDSIALARKYPVSGAEFYNLIPFPNTVLFNWVKERHLFLRPPEIYLNDASHWRNEPVFETPELPRSARRRLFAACQATAKSIRASRIRRYMRRFGPFANLAAHLYVSDFFQNRIMVSTRLSRILRRTYLTLSGQTSH